MLSPPPFIPPTPVPALEKRGRGIGGKKKKKVTKIKKPISHHIMNQSSRSLLSQVHPTQDFLPRRLPRFARSCCPCVTGTRGGGWWLDGPGANETFRSDSRIEAEGGDPYPCPRKMGIRGAPVATASGIARGWRAAGTSIPPGRVAASWPRRSAMRRPIAKICASARVASCCPSAWRLCCTSGTECSSPPYAFSRGARRGRRWWKCRDTHTGPHAGTGTSSWSVWPPRWSGSWRRGWRGPTAGGRGWSWHVAARGTSPDPGGDTWVGWAADGARIDWMGSSPPSPARSSGAPSPWGSTAAPTRPAGGPWSDTPIPGASDDTHSTVLGFWCARGDRNGS